jgi:hypothetical protein
MLFGYRCAEIICDLNQNAPCQYNHPSPWDRRVDVGVDPAGDVLVNNNWQDWHAGIERVEEARSTLAGGEGVLVFYGMTNPVRAPMIGPAHGYE